MKTPIPFALATLLLATTLPARAADAPAARLTPEAGAQHDARIAWWREGRFGMFIHWGLYAVPAGKWKGQPVAGIGEWIMNKAKIPVKEYEQFATQFNPTKFEAEAWAQLAQDAGMKYRSVPQNSRISFTNFSPLAW